MEFDPLAISSGDTQTKSGWNLKDAVSLQFTEPGITSLPAYWMQQAYLIANSRSLLPSSWENLKSFRHKIQVFAGTVFHGEVLGRISLLFTKLTR